MNSLQRNCQTRVEKDLHNIQFLNQFFQYNMLFGKLLLEYIFYIFTHRYIRLTLMYTIKSRNYIFMVMFSNNIKIFHYSNSSWKVLRTYT